MSKTFLQHKIIYCFIKHWTKKMEVIFLLLHWQQAAQLKRVNLTWLTMTLRILDIIIVLSAEMISQALISKIHRTLLANQKRDSEFNVHVVIFSLSFCKCFLFFSYFATGVFTTSLEVDLVLRRSCKGQEPCHTREVWEKCTCNWFASY